LRLVPEPAGHVDDIEIVDVGRVAVHAFTEPTTTDNGCREPGI
jgi:hypothetical protein